MATEKDSTTAKATSAVHVPHRDASTAAHEVVSIEQQWSDEEIRQKNLEAQQAKEEKESKEKATPTVNEKKECDPESEECQ